MAEISFESAKNIVVKYGFCGDCRHKYESKNCVECDCYIAVKQIIDAVPVVHGRWVAELIPTGVSAFGVDEMTCEEEECSECHRKYWVGEQRNYCPNCGAKMDLEEER